MGFSSRGITSTDILSAVTSDSTKWKGADIAAILADTAALPANKYSFMDFWGTIAANFTVNNALNDYTLGDVYCQTLTGNPTPSRAFALMRIAGIRETSGGANQLNVTSQLQVDRAAAGWLDCLDIPNNAVEVLANSENPSGLMFMGHDNIVNRVMLGATHNFRWYQTRTTATGIEFEGVQCGIRVMF